MIETISAKLNRDLKNYGIPITVSYNFATQDYAIRDKKGNLILNNLTAQEVYFETIIRILNLKQIA